jgi:hypothetical protein
MLWNQGTTPMMPSVVQDLVWWIYFFGRYAQTTLFYFIRPQAGLAFNFFACPKKVNKERAP